MAGACDYARIFISDCKIKLAKAMEFRFDFVAGLIFSFAGSFINIVFQFLIFSKTRGYPGWSFNQVLLYQSVTLLIIGIRDTVFGNVRTIFELQVQRGDVDRILLYPFPSLGMILVKGFQLNGISAIVAGLVTLFYSIGQLKLIVYWWQVGLFLLFVVIGLMLYIASIIVYCALTLRFIYDDKLRELFDRILNFGFYPAEIFSGLIKIIYLFIIPIALFSYFPSQVLLGRINIIGAFGAGFSLFLFWASVKLWDIQITKYSSAGG